MTTTELAAQLAADPRFRDPKSSLFDETAERYGRDFAGLAFVQACLKVDQEREPCGLDECDCAEYASELPEFCPGCGGCHVHTAGCDVIERNGAN